MSAVKKVAGNVYFCDFEGGGRATAQPAGAEAAAGRAVQFPMADAVPKRSVPSAAQSGPLNPANEPEVA